MRLAGAEDPHRGAAPERARDSPAAAAAGAGADSGAARRSPPASSVRPLVRPRASLRPARWLPAIDSTLASLGAALVRARTHSETDTATDHSLVSKEAPPALPLPPPPSLQPALSRAAPLLTPRAAAAAPSAQSRAPRGGPAQTFRSSRRFQLLVSKIKSH